MSSLKSDLYQLVAQIPAGQVTTYKLLGDALGTSAYRHLGRLLSQNPHPHKIPCHRVVKSSGQVGGYMGENTQKAQQKKKQLLQKEGIKFSAFHLLDFQAKLFIPTSPSAQPKL